METGDNMMEFQCGRLMLRVWRVYRVTDNKPAIQMEIFDEYKMVRMAIVDISPSNRNLFDRLLSMLSRCKRASTNEKMRLLEKVAHEDIMGYFG